MKKCSASLRHPLMRMLFSVWANSTQLWCSKSKPLFCLFYLEFNLDALFVNKPFCLFLLLFLNHLLMHVLLKASIQLVPSSQTIPNPSWISAFFQPADHSGKCREPLKPSNYSEVSAALIDVWSLDLGDWNSDWIIHFKMVDYEKSWGVLITD